MRIRAKHVGAALLVLAASLVPLFSFASVASTDAICNPMYRGVYVGCPPPTPHEQ